MSTSAVIALIFTVGCCAGLAVVFYRVFFKPALALSKKTREAAAEAAELRELNEKQRRENQMGAALLVFKKNLPDVTILPLTSGVVFVYNHHQLAMSRDRNLCTYSQLPGDCEFSFSFEDHPFTEQLYFWGLSRMGRRDIIAEA